MPHGFLTPTIQHRDCYHPTFRNTGESWDPGVGDPTLREPGLVEQTMGSFLRCGLLFLFVQLDWSFDSLRVEAIAAPFPVFWFLN